MSDHDDLCEFHRLPRQHQAILEALAGELLHGRTWGEPPDVLFATVERGAVTLRPLGVPGIIWAGREPSEVVEGLAATAEHILPLYRYLTPAGMIGVAMRCEAWILRDQPGVKVAALSMAELRAHPDATKCRFICCVDRSGTTYAAETDSAGHVLGYRLSEPGDRDSTATGAIPDALDRILHAILCVPMPTRPDPLASDTPRKDTPA